MNNKGQIGTIVTVIVFILLFIFVVGSIDTVDQSEVGVTVRFKQITGTLDPGMHWTGFFTHTYTYDTGIQQKSIIFDRDSSAVDKTGQDVYGEISVNYRLNRDPVMMKQMYSDGLRSLEAIERAKLIDKLIRSSFKEVTSQYEAIEIIQNRAEVKAKTIARIKANFPNKEFELLDVSVDNIDFSQGYKEAIELKKIKSQQKLAEMEQTVIIQEQQKQALIVAETEAQKMKLQKEQISDKLNTQLMLERWNGILPTTLIITQGDNGMGMLLDLATGSVQSESNEVKSE